MRESVGVFPCNKGGWLIQNMRETKFYVFAPGPLKWSRTQKSHQCTKKPCHYKRMSWSFWHELSIAEKCPLHLVKHSVFTSIYFVFSENKRRRAEERKMHLHLWLRHVTFIDNLNILPDEIHYPHRCKKLIAAASPIFNKCYQRVNLGTALKWPPIKAIEKFQLSNLEIINYSSSRYRWN